MQYIVTYNGSQFIAQFDTEPTAADLDYLAAQMTDDPAEAAGIAQDLLMQMTAEWGREGE